MNKGEPRKTKTNHSAGLRSHGLRGGLGQRQRIGQKEPEEQRQHAEIDVPDQPRPDQGELLAQGEIGASAAASRRCRCERRP